MRQLNLLAAVLLLAIGLLTTSCQTANSQQAINQKADIQTPPATPQPKQETENEMKRISVDEAKAAYDRAAVVIVDTRGAEQFKQEHIKGAVNIPANEFEQRYKELPTDKQIIAYCSWPSEHTSARAVLILKQNGINNAAALLGGTEAWKNKGYPMEKQSK